MRETVVLILTVLAVAMLLIGCSKKPTEEDCQEAVNHMLDLWAAEDPAAAGNREKLGAMIPGLVKACTEKYTKDKVNCLLEAESKAEADLCSD